MSAPAPTTMRAAGFWRRASAFGLDYLPMALYLVLITGLAQVINMVQPTLLTPLFGNPVAGQLSGFILVTAPISLYFILFEASPRQATWGKQRRGIIVVGPAQRRLSWQRSLARTALKFTPWELAHLCIWQASSTAEMAPLVSAGLILVWVLIGINAACIWLRKDHRALYDLLSGTMVVYR